MRENEDEIHNFPIMARVMIIALCDEGMKYVKRHVTPPNGKVLSSNS